MVELEAIKQNPSVIELVDNPSLEMQMIAVTHDIQLILKINNKIYPEVQQYVRHNS